MLLNGQKRASAVGRSCRPRSGAACHIGARVTKFLVRDAAIRRRLLLTGGLLVRIQPEEPIFSTTYGYLLRWPICYR